jgi:uncharacterized phosphosugar-binding protein
VILLHPGFWARDMAAEDYIARLQNEIIQSRDHLPALTESAERAASEFLSGGNLWAAGRQPDFIAEACQRAGGLMAIAPLTNQVPATHDVILYAVPGSLNDNDRKILEDWHAKGATVITFSSPAGLFQNKFPLDTVLNVAELWAWTAEFVAACTRLGKMPVLYQSYGLPGGYERAKKYQGKKFHDDLTIPPFAAGILGKEYLDQIQHRLARIQQTEMPKMDHAAEWWRKAKSSTALVTGHMFPAGHGQDPRTIHVCDFVRAPAREDKDLLGANPPDFVFYLGYQFAPQKLLAQAKATRVKLVYTDVQPGQPPEPSDNILYIAPTWPLTDACVNVPGYDIPILPASGVVQAAIYWTIVSKAFPEHQIK